MQDIKYFKADKTVIDMVEHIYAAYLIMKVRMKISYEACRTNQTIQELFLTAILKSYKARNGKKLVKNPYPAIKSYHLDALKNASIKDLTQRGLIEEAKAQECIKIKEKGLCSPNSPSGHDHDKSHDQIAKPKNKMIGSLV
jgi:hypothetical protein